MNVDSLIVNSDAKLFGNSAAPLRVVASSSWRGDGGEGWQVVGRLGAERQAATDCLLIAGADVATIDPGTFVHPALPLVLVADDAVPPAWLDHADGYILPGDGPAEVALVLARAAAPAAGPRVADLSDGVARTINALSAEAGRIAEQLAKLAATHRAEAASAAIDARLVRRILKLRRDRERYFPAEIFADPAWDLLLDLTAARLEGKRVPVSSLCIAAAVPTTTALRWIRSLTEAGLFDRYTDPTDARRSHVEIAESAAAAMLGYLRAFSEAFALR
jgi:hypothetical protein